MKSEALKHWPLYVCVRACSLVSCKHSWLNRRHCSAGECPSFMRRGIAVASRPLLCWWSGRNGITQSLMSTAAARLPCKYAGQLLSWHRLTRMLGKSAKAFSPPSRPLPPPPPPSLRHLPPKSWVSSVVSKEYGNTVRTHTRTAFTFYRNSLAPATLWSE